MKRTKWRSNTFTHIMTIESILNYSRNHVFPIHRNSFLFNNSTSRKENRERFGSGISYAGYCTTSTLQQIVRLLKGIRRSLSLWKVFLSVRKGLSSHLAFRCRSRSLINRSVAFEMSEPCLENFRKMIQASWNSWSQRRSI